MEFSLISCFVTVKLVLLLLQPARGQDEPLFAEEPGPVSIQRYSTITLFWLIHNEPCESQQGSSWFMSIVSQNLTLFLRGKLETPFPEDYNVTVEEITCSEDGRKRINVTLVIELSDIVLQNIDFVRCKMSNGGENRTVESEKVYFNETVTMTTDAQTTEPTPCTPSTTSASSDSAPSTLTEIEPAETSISCSAAGTRPYLLLLCIIQCILMCNFPRLTTILQ